jgi:hypothetical protein
MERGNPRFHIGSPMTWLPISIWWLPYGNGDRHIPIWKWGLFVNPHFHMGNQMERIPVSIWGSPYWNGSPFLNGDGSVTNPFPNRVCFHLGTEGKITIWECFLYGDHRFHMVITVWKWAGRLGYSHMGNPRFRIEFVSIWGPTYTQFGWEIMEHRVRTIMIDE